MCGSCVGRQFFTEKSNDVHIKIYTFIYYWRGKSVNVSDNKSIIIHFVLWLKFYLMELVCNMFGISSIRRAIVMQGKKCKIYLFKPINLWICLWQWCGIGSAHSQMLFCIWHQFVYKWYGLYAWNCMFIITFQLNSPTKKLHRRIHVGANFTGFMCLIYF